MPTIASLVTGTGNSVPDQAGSLGTDAVQSTAGGTAVSLREDRRSETLSLYRWTRYMVCESPSEFVALYWSQMVNLDPQLLKIPWKVLDCA